MDIKQTYHMGVASELGNYAGSFANKKSIKNNSLVQRKGKQGKLTVKKKISASGYMMKIAQAKTPSQVSAVIRIARADIRFVKSCNSERTEVEKAVRILKRVIAKSKIKIQRLRKEEEMIRQEKQARSAEKRELAEKIRQDRSRKKKARCANETADTCDGESATVSRTTYFDLGDKENIAGKAVIAQNISDSYLESTEPLPVEVGLDAGGVDLSAMSVGVDVFL